MLPEITVQSDPNNKHAEARRRARACTSTGVCCILSAFGLSGVVARWILTALHLQLPDDGAMGVAFVLFLIWLVVGLDCLHRAWLLLLLGTSEQREHKQRDFE